ncbi:hypothetical protein BC940DRAFT_295850 [Gongronella butleri]|nr:hypothetical protein BC940DRAFT_295850 [Gongronella butleri]
MENKQEKHQSSAATISHPHSSVTMMDKDAPRDTQSSSPEQTPSLDDTIQEPSTKKKKKRMADRNRCIRWLCCACCLPKWATIIVWFIIISILIVVIVLGGIMATFRLPTVEMGGVLNQTQYNQSKPISFNGYNIQFNFGLQINAVNPNLLPIYLSDMVAKAYYPDPDGSGNVTPVGGGYLDSQELYKYSNISFTFPFSLVYSPDIDVNQTILDDIVSRCGLTGEEPRDLTIKYDILLTARVLFVKIHPTINSVTTFACPIKNNTLSF